MGGEGGIKPYTLTPFLIQLTGLVGKRTIKHRSAWEDFAVELLSLLLYLVPGLLLVFLDAVFQHSAAHEGVSLSQKRFSTNDAYGYILLAVFLTILFCFLLQALKLDVFILFYATAVSFKLFNAPAHWCAKRLHKRSV